MHPPENTGKQEEKGQWQRVYKVEVSFSGRIPSEPRPATSAVSASGYCLSTHSFGYNQKGNQEKDVLILLFLEWNTSC